MVDFTVDVPGMTITKNFGVRMRLKRTADIRTSGGTNKGTIWLSRTKVGNGVRTDLDEWLNIVKKIYQF